ncbi:PLD nuclease N-terminal domain-containing protein [Arthrobacter sp. efr-133-TYG-104]|uniref:PLD nuclease N-terminal domain-containing protein n=1 Tax=unclassified Arthrobacter TaxID=235627 RepID=UPI0025512A63|nr:PLD nuclease N-terminal domain-containing protein [Arthrobacter sp. efr-133-TYG-104]
MVRVVGVVVVLVFFVYALVDAIRTDKRATRGLPKLAWIVVMIVLPLLGAVLWFIFGRPYGKPEAQVTRHYPAAPDDDPEFLRNLEIRRRNQAEEQRLRQLKAKRDKEKRARGQEPQDTDGLN